MKQSSSKLRPDTSAVKPERNFAIDLLRAIMVFYIVGWWHLLAYVGNGVEHVNWVSNSLTNVVLGSFTFLSGYGLGSSKDGTVKRSIWRFYRRRLARIYPLYLLALALFVVVWLTDPFSALKAAFGLSMFWPEPPMTLWFITMILVFYLLTPGLLRFGPAATGLLALSLWTAFLLFNRLVHAIDTRLLMFFPTFVAGLIWRRFRTMGWARWGLIWLLGFLLAFWSTQYDKPGSALQSSILSIPAVLTGSVVFLLAAERWGAKLGSTQLIQWIGYASFSIYLFHRVIYTLAFRAWNPHSEWQQLAYLLLFGLPLSLFVGYAIQSTYDFLVVEISRRSLFA